MAKKPKGGKYKVKLSKQQKERKKRAQAAAIRMIAKQEGLTEKQARRRYKDAIIEVIFERPTKYATRRFIEITPGKFREIPKGKAFREINAEGPVRNIGYISRITKLKRYWEFVNLMAEEYGTDIKEARRKIKEKEISIKELYEFYFVPLEKKG
jgi:hypothetical protein